MDFERIDWQPLEPLTSKKFNTMANNDYFLFVRKIEGGVRNISPANWQPRSNPPILKGNVVTVAEYREFSPGFKIPKKKKGKKEDDNAKADEEKKDDKPKIPNEFTKTINFPPGYFSPIYLPVVVASIGVRSGVKKISYVIGRPTPAGFTVTVREHTPDAHFSNKNLYFITYIAQGIKNA